MPKNAPRATSDHKLASIIGVVVAVLAAGFAAGWLYMQHKERQSREITYLKLPSVAISRDGHSMSATFAVRTSRTDADWASKNKDVLEQVMKRALLEADPVAARQPGGLQKMQEQVRGIANSTLQSERIQEVLVTDFLVSEGDG
jgi:flagellar basal body-associated protein FliL